MKKFLLMILICVISVSGLCSCKENTGSENGVNNNKTVSKNADEESNNREVSIEVLKNSAETSGKEFSYVELDEDSVMITGYDGKSNIVVIPEKIDGKTVTKIESYVFANDSTVEAIKFPDTLTELGDFIFTNNKNLQILILGNGLETISKNMCLCCANLCNVDIGTSVKNISVQAFGTCKNLKTIYIPENVENIEVGAFIGEGSENLVIQGKTGSVAESYAKENGFKFEAK